MAIGHPAATSTSNADHTQNVTPKDNTAMDISSLSLAELRRLQTKVETEIRRRSDTAKKDLLKRMQKLAAEHGMSLTDVIGGQEATEKAAPAPKKAAAKPAAKKAAKPASVIKFRHPENAAIGWTGHGRKPQWVIDWLAQGKALDDLRAASAEA
jgi:DNA-binding protein H-NS